MMLPSDTMVFSLLSLGQVLLQWRFFGELPVTKSSSGQGVDVITDILLSLFAVIYSSLSFLIIFCQHLNMDKHCLLGVSKIKKKDHVQEQSGLSSDDNQCDGFILSLWTHHIRCCHQGFFLCMVQKLCTNQPSAELWVFIIYNATLH